MKNNNTFIIVIICITSAFVINTLFIFLLDLGGITIGAGQLFKNLLIFFALLLITAAVTLLYRNARKNETTYYFKNLYNTVLESTDVGVAILNDVNKFEFANMQFRNLIKMGDVPMAGRNAADILPKSVYRFILEYRLQSEDNLEATVSQTIHYKGTYIHYTIFRILDNTDTPKFITTAQNHTDLIEMEEKLTEQLEETQFHAEAKESLLANVSHELKTPLNAIIGLSHILEGTELTSHQKELVSKINISSDFLLSLINDVLDFSKVKHGSINMTPTYFRLDNLLADVCEIFYPITAQRAIELQKDYSFGSDLCLHLDRIRLEQVLINLINNACKFTEVGYVRISVSVLQELQESITLKFAVEDTGIGIDYEDIPSLFTEFHQLENHLTKLHQGTGLGLPICKHLVENMGGSLWVESKKGMGSVFYFTITAPRYYGETTSDKNIQEETHFCGYGEKVLVVEDTLINYEVVEELLSQVDISCDYASDGLKAIELCHEKESDYYRAILMDIHMPEMDGYECAKRLKEVGITSPVIALTASNIDNATQLEYADLMDGFILKPFKYTQLYDALRPYFKDINGPCPDIVPNSTVKKSPYSGRDKAIENLGGNVALYEKHLAKFQENYVNSADDLENLLSTGELKEAKILAHSVKGLAGTLGLLPLSESARKLEEALDAGEDNPDYLLSSFRSDLMQIVKAS